MTDAKDKPVAWVRTTYPRAIFEQKPQSNSHGDNFSPLYDQSALTQAREEGRREGMREAAEICDRFAQRKMSVEEARDAITRASEGK